MLAATLVNRPHLAGKVLGLDLEPHVDFVGACSDLFRPRDESTNSIMKNLTVLMKETEIMGLLLCLASNLRDLVLDVRIGMEADGLHHAHAHDAIEHIFGYAYNRWSEKLELLSIPGLSHLRNLRLKSRTLQWAWCQLPQLTSLSLGRFCEVMDYEAYPEEICQIKELEVELSTSIVDPDFDTYVAFTPFLKRLPTLQRLVITLCNTEFDEDVLLHDARPFLEHSRWGSFDKLVEFLLPVTSTLQHLVIGGCTHYCPNFLGFTWPITTICHFRNLRTLDVLHKALDELLPVSFVAILPPSLEQLVVRTPYRSIVPDLEEVAQQTSHFRNLRLIELFPREHRGGGFEYFHYRQHRAWTRLAEVGILVNIWWHENDYRDDWDDPNYDPFIIEIVNFLDGLSAYA
jgi:hypothetical protein